MAAIEMRPMTLGEILDRTFTLYRRHFLLFVGIMAIPQLFILAMNLLPQALPGVIGATGQEPGSDSMVAVAIGFLVGFFVFLILFFAMYALAQAATVFAVSELILGRQSAVQSAYARVKGKIWRMIDVMFSTGIRIVLGLMLFIIPGVLLALRYSVAIPCAILEDLKARDAMKRSRELTEGRRGDAFLILLLSAVLGWIAAFVLTVPIGVLSVMFAREGSSPLWVNTAAHFAEFVSGVLVGPIGTIAIALYYYDCRVRKEALDLQVMLSALSPVPAAGAPTQP